MITVFFFLSHAPRHPSSQIIAAIQGNSDQDRDGQRGCFSAVITNAKMFPLEGRKRAPNLASLEDALPQARDIVPTASNFNEC